MSGAADSRFQYYRREVVGGITSAIAGLPVELNYGLIAVAPLGAAFASMGIMAAIYSAAAAGLVGALAGSRGAMIAGSRPALMLIVASLIASLMQDPVFISNGQPRAGLMMVMVVLTVMLAGLIQIGFGLLRLGRVITFIPQPVLAGFSAGVALSIIIFALNSSLGLPVKTSPLAWFGLLVAMKWWSAPVMLASAWAMKHPPRAAKAVPPVVVALVAGILLHEAIAAAVGEASLSGRVSPIAGGMPEWVIGEALQMLNAEALWGRIPGLLPYAGALAVLASLETLLAAATADLMTGERTRASRELIAQGAGNLAAACVGGTPSAASTARVLANLNAGGRGRTSSVVYSLLMLALVVLVPHWFAYLPNAVIGGMLLVFAWGMFDEWQRRLYRLTLLERGSLTDSQRRELSTNTLIVVLVAMVAVAGNLMQAIALGVAVSLFIFVRGHALGVVRGVYYGTERRSLKVRNAEDARYLKLNGGQIGIVEVEGALFFGSADRLAREVEALAEHTGIIIIDLRRVSDIDSTGVRILQQIVRRLAVKHCRLLLAHLRPAGRLAEALSAYQFEAVLSRQSWFADLDRALEFAEERVLQLRGGAATTSLGLILSQADIAKGLDPTSTELLALNLVEHRFADGDYLFRRGDVGETLYVITQGSVGIWIPLDDGHLRRIAAFGPGVSFGEMALIEHQPRSADALADGDVVVYELRRPVLDELLERHPEIGGRILLNISRGLSQRLRTTTDDLRATDER